MLFSSFSWASTPNLNAWWHGCIHEYNQPHYQIHIHLLLKTCHFPRPTNLFSETRKLKTKLYRKPTDCISLLHFHSHYPLSCKKGSIYSQVPRYKMIISENHILQEEPKNLIRILLACAYPLHFIIKNIKKPWHITAITRYPNEHQR